MMRFAALAVAAVLGGAAVRAEDAPKPPTAQKEHEWLKAFAGEWELKGEMTVAPGQPPVTSTGTETARLVGGFWVVSEIKGECMGRAMTGQMTVGFDPAKKKYVGSWTDSMSTGLMVTESTYDPATKTSTGFMEGPDMTGKVTRMKGVTEFPDPDRRVFTMYANGPDGKEAATMRITYTRRK